MTYDAFDVHTAAALDRVLTAAERRDVPPEVAVPLIRNGVRQIIDSGACSIIDRRLALALIDLTNAVEQLAARIEAS